MNYQQSITTIDKQKNFNLWNIFLSLFGFFLITISIIYFNASINKPFIGANFYFINGEWTIQSVDPTGLASQAGISNGDTPMLINEEPAKEFLKIYEDEGRCIGLLVKQLTVTNIDGYSISVTIENTSLSIYSKIELLAYLIVCIIFWATAYYVFLKKPNNRVSILLLLCSLTFGLAISGNAAVLRLVPMASHLSVVSTVLGPWLLLHFFIVLPEEKTTLQNNRLLYLIYIPSFITLILYPFLGNANGEPVAFFRLIRLIEMAIGLLAVIIVVIYNYVSAVSPKTRQQMKILLYFCIAAVAPFLLISIFPMIISGDIIISSSFSIVFLSLIPIGMGYAVMTQKLLDINIFIRRGVIYTAISLVIASVFSLVIIPMLYYVQSLSILQTILISLVMGVLASVLFGPVKNGIEYLVDKFFYKDKYDYHKTINELGSSLNSITDIVIGSTIIVNTLAERINLAGACLFTINEEGNAKLWLP